MSEFVVDKNCTVRPYVIAVDLGGTKILVAIVDVNNSIVCRKVISTCIEKGYQQALENIVHVSRECTKECHISLAECCISVCAPGPIDKAKGMIINSVNLGWGIVPVLSFLQQSLGIPIYVEHDAKAAALGEYHYGRGKGEQSMVYVGIGTGVGGGIILDGELYRGMHNYAGEIGHFTIDYDGDSGLTDIKRNVQSFMSGLSLVNNYKKTVQQSVYHNNTTNGIGTKKNSIDNEEEITGEYITELALAGDELALKVVHNAGKGLGIMVACLAMILDIELFVIGSSVARMGNMLLDTARKTVCDYSFASVAAMVRIESSILKDDTAILGCVHVARYVS